MNAHEEGIVNMLCNFLPEFLQQAEETINWLHNPSKLLLESRDQTGVFTAKNLNFYKLYLNPKSYYEEFNDLLVQQVLEDIKTEPPSPPLPLKKAKANFYQAIDELEQELYVKVTNNEPLAPFDKLFLERAIARFYESLSLIQNKKALSSLLHEAINQKNQKLLPLAVGIDPNILKLAEVQSFLDSLPKEQRLGLEEKIIKAQRTPILSHSKTCKSKKFLLYLSIVDFIGVIKGPYALKFNSHKRIAADLGVIPDIRDVDDVNYFNKLYNLVKKSHQLQ
ncbi:hypothetical protein [Thiomicrorhabdus xiamenensis]|uniref:Uncharacterized protein n=1 Tax=Thiomicrorhabdus xiamenensis TaxID=2739063 RepID=A0A7D4TDV3_9GAMM|nr:hypothetical protein [Thiomicrorhabdus xiamenensis]QKI88907.1 hypothetical protein HQN79_04650 [Thiomicrorhabdus xiamenensis]